MITVKLIGMPSCRRYQRMRENTIREAERLGISIQLDEISDTEQLSEFNPLSLPRLYIQDKLVASQNPPAPQDIIQALQQAK